MVDVCTVNMYEVRDITRETTGGDHFDLCSKLGTKVKVIATGGFSRYVTDFVHVDRADIDHTLEGARLICEMNS